jgi:hypothetical protein
VRAFFWGGPQDGAYAEVPGLGDEARYPPLAVATHSGARYERAHPLQTVDLNGEIAVLYRYDRMLPPVATSSLES